jgi:hypothetical protein
MVISYLVLKSNSFTLTLLLHKDTWQALITHPLSYIDRPYISTHLISLFSRRKKGKERGETLLLLAEIPWRKNLHSCSPSSFPPSRKG